MRYLPVFLDVASRRALVLGAGNTAERKAAALRRSGAEVVRAERFTPGLLEGCAVAIGADAPQAELEALSAAAQARGIPVNVVDRPGLCSYITPAVVDRDPLILAVSSGGAAPVLARLVRARIEAMLPPRLARVAAVAGSLKDELRARLPDSGARRRVLERMLEGRAAELVLAGEERAGLAEMRREMEGAEAAPPGIVYLVGAGPGPADLVTLRAHRLLGEADVIVHDPGVSAAVLDLARRDAELIGLDADPADEAVPLLVRLAGAGGRVVRLFAGDPGASGRTAGPTAALAGSGSAFEVVPGVGPPPVARRER